MSKYFTLDKSPYKGVNTIRVSADYNKREGGYTITAECIEYFKGGNLAGLFSKPFCKEYYQHDGDGITVIIPAARQSAKKKAEAEAICEREAEKYAHIFLNHVNEKLGTDIQIIEEA